MKTSSLVMTLVMLAIFAGALAIASFYPAGARFQPFVIAIPALALCVVQLILDVLQRRAVDAPADTRNEFEKAQERMSRATGKQLEFETAHTAPMFTETALPEEGQGRRELIVWSYFLGFMVGIVLFGFWVAIPVFLFTFLRFMAAATWRTTLLTTTIASAIFYGVFALGLKVSVHPGFVTPHIVSAVQAFLR